MTTRKLPFVVVRNMYICKNLSFSKMRAILLFLILIQTRGKTIQTCPKYCTCKLGAQAEWLRIKCSNELQNIRDININSVSVELVQLDLSKNNIYTIEANIFKNLTNLKRLNLSQNYITSIDTECFNGLGNLERLDLSKNQISTIDAYTFRKLPNLKRLDLSGNNISMVKPSLFHDLLALERLKLNENKLTTLMEGTFFGLNSLKQLDLSNNPWRCDCELYWFSNWIHNSSIKLNPAPKCASPVNIKGEFVKKLKYSENIQCQLLPPTIELRPIHNQVVFAGDSITLKCRAPSITDDKNARLSWLWYPNTTTENADLNAFLDPQKSLSNIKVDNRYLADSGIVDSSLSIVPIKDEHNGQWNCLLVSVNGNRTKAISVIVISEETRYCPLAVTKNNKGIYTWPKTVVGWRAELPCEGNHLSGLMQMPLKASYQCNVTGYWENLNTELCPYISHITKSLEQFSKVNLSLTRINLLESAKKFKNFTGNSIKITDPIEVDFITQTIENYLNFLIEGKELGTMLIDVINTLINVPKNILKKAEISFKSCTRLIKAVEKIIEHTPSIQFYKKNMALEEFRVKRDSFTGLICTWYSNNNPEIRFLQCTTNNRTSPINIKDRTIEASIHLPASLLQYSQEVIAHQLMISVYSNNRLFPKIINNDNMDVASCIIGSKLYGMSIQNLTEPVYIMLKAPLYYYAGKKLLPVVWDDTLNKSGGWTSDGCYLRNILNNLIIFHCNRLGYYGLLQDTSTLDYDGNSISGAKFRYSNPAIYIGSITIITCLVIMCITYIICYTSITMPKKAKHCVINTWFAMALLSFFYSIGIYQTENIPICQGVGLILHYLSLCCLLWMAVFASNMYKKLSKSDLEEDIPDNDLQDPPIPKPLLGLYLVGWGIAMIICGISGAINLREYAGYSYCFLTSAPALVALFVPAGFLILSEGTQATENMDLELLEPSTNISIDRNSAHSVQTVLSDIEDSEHSQITQLKGQIIILTLYLISWITAAAATTKSLNAYISFDETIFAILYSLFSSSLGIFILFFYGIARNDVRSQWLRMGCWFQKRKNQCCRTRSISDANPVITTQSLVQNLVAPMSNSQATQVTSDSNSISSSRYTNRSQTYNAFKVTDIVTNKKVSPVGRKMTNMNLVVLHRQQYRSDNSVTTYIEPTCVEMFYNPHQSGVARKFFRKQRRHTKNSNLGPRKQGDGGAMSDAGSCISVSRSTTKLESNIDQTILSSSAKVNNTNIHVELNPINDVKNVNILSDSGGSISEERNVPMRFVIGQEDFFRNVRKVNNNCRLHESINTVSNSARNNCQKIELLNITLHESDMEIKTDEEKHLQSVSQQCSLEYSSEIESITQMTSEKSDHNLPEIYETVETIMEANLLKKDCQNENEFHEVEKHQSNANLKWLTHSNSMHCLPIDTAKPLRNNYCNSLNDITSLASFKKCEYLKSFSDLQNIASSNLCNKNSLSEKSFSKLELSFSKVNSEVKDNLHNLVQNITSTRNIECASNVCTDELKSKQKCINSMIDMTSFMHSSCNIVRNLDSNNEVESLNKQQNIQHIEGSEVHLNNPNTYLQIVKKETSV
ncbi:adhesion G protein-coupled receptor A3 isoform X2 [Frieseomelitta varia]|uniref:adhesion G protein-coupled receptor A3 isoform X2 n=1 Tax=Frieseomelitta varia TaxID=561572 RepID=UPI001CB69A61|nr:adhesion G protein-coupled receptor A3 isoform X2 [Frieseomelitta varia]